MPPEQHLPAYQDADPQPLHPTTLWKPPAPTTRALTLYQVPVPDAVPVQLPDGRTAWARPVQERLIPEPPAPTPTREPMPAWAKAFSLAMRQPHRPRPGRRRRPAHRRPRPRRPRGRPRHAFPGRPGPRRPPLRRRRPRPHPRPPGHHPAPRRRHPHRPGAAPASTLVFAPHIDTGGDRLFGRSGSVTVQLGDRNRAKH